MKRKSVYQLLIYLGLIIIWFGGAALTNNEFIIPYPQDVIKAMFADIGEGSFYQIIFSSISRQIIGTTIAMIISIGLAIISGLNKKVEILIQPIVKVLTSIPNISFIIIILIWFGSEASLIIISTLVLFVSIYPMILTAMKQYDENLTDIIKENYPNYLYLVRYVYLPYLKPFIISALKIAASLGFKVIITAEVLSQVSGGIGKEIQFYRSNGDMIHVFSWTIWIVVISGLQDLLINCFMKEKELSNGTIK